MPFHGQLMKENQLNVTRQQMAEHNGYVLASTWLQCSPAQGVKGALGPHLARQGRMNAALPSCILM